MIARWVWAGWLMVGGVVWGQAPAVPEAPPQLSPAAAYTQAMFPLETTRKSIANWSETEQAALGVAIKQAGDACAARTADSFSGDALIDYAKLCSLGQAWPAVFAATGKYLAEKTDAKPRLTEAYAGRVDAELHLKDEAEALKDCREMLARVPYSEVVAEVSGEAIDYMELLFTADAITVAQAREGLILATLDAGTDAASGEKPGLALVTAVPELYRQGMMLANLQQLAGLPVEAAATVDALETALPDTLSTDDALRVAAARRRYRLIGGPLTGVEGQRQLLHGPAVPELPMRGAVTALLVFPDWCAQCVALAKKLPVGRFVVDEAPAWAWGLLVETMPAQKRPETAKAGGFYAAYAADDLADTPVVTVPAEVLDRFDGSEVPLLVIADAKGIVRLIQPVDEAALAPGGTFDSAVALVGKRWPGVAVVTPAKVVGVSP